MSHAQKIRNALGAIYPAGLTFEQLNDKTGIPQKKLRGNLAPFLARGEIHAKLDAEKLTRYHTNKDYKRGGGTKRKPRKEKVAKKSGRKSGSREAGNPKDSSNKNGAELRELIIDNYLAASKQLREAVAIDVEGIEDGTLLGEAIANHERAEKILAATRAH